MMNANVRRLVLDPSPRAGAWMFLFNFIFSVLCAALIAAGDGRPNVLGGYFLGFWASMCVDKVPAWLTLPVSRAELHLAQFWQFLGIPYFTLAFSALVGFGAAAATGHFRASWLEILGFMSAETLVVVTTGASPLLRTLFGKRLGTVGSSIASSVPTLGAMALAMFLLFGEMNSAVLMSLLWLGALTTIVCLAALVCNQSLPLALPLAQIKNLQTISLGPHPPARSIAGRPAIRPSGFLTLVWSSLWRAAPYAAFSLCIYAIFGIATRYAPPSSVVRAVYILQLFPLLSLLAALTPAVMDTHRVRAGLPISAFKRTLAIHLVGPALLAPTWVVMIAVTALARPEAITPQWWIDCRLSSLMASAMIALAAPVRMRFGPIGFRLFLSSFIGLGSFMLALGGGGSPWDPIIAGPMSLALLSGWIWTYLELAYGRKAYQNRFPASARWRGTPT